MNTLVPNPVLGGVTTFLFASVMTSGLRVLSYIRWTRRDRFILAAALSFGTGDLLVPGIFTHLFDGVDNPSNGLQGLLDAITIVLSTPCEFSSLIEPTPISDTYDSTCTVLAAGIVAVILNLVLPEETAEELKDDDVEVVDHELGQDTEKKMTIN